MYSTNLKFGEKCAEGTQNLEKNVQKEHTISRLMCSRNSKLRKEKQLKDEKNKDDMTKGLGREQRES